MSGCEQLTANAALGAAPALRAVDCLANETAAAAFGRLFGSGGALLPVLTLALTLYIAFFALSLLTGRSRLGISALTPRMLTLGLVLTFATSWVAYQNVVWNLAIGGPDQLAGILLNTSSSPQDGTATTLFADRLDIVFAAIAKAAEFAGGGQAAQQATQQAAETTQAAQAAQVAQTGSFTPVNLMWMGALLLLLGTVGVLVTARIALAVLLALGPVFIVFALFNGTRGLFAGWLRGVALTAITPLFVVAGGGLILELLVPILSHLIEPGSNTINGYAAMALFLVASVHLALMFMVLTVSGSIVSGWQVFGAGAREGSGSAASVPTMTAPQFAYGPGIGAAPALAPTASRSIVMASAAPPTGSESSSPSSSSAHRDRTVIAPAVAALTSLPALPRQRARGVGSRFAARPSQASEMLK